MKLINFRFQRNGVRGTCFYHAIVTGYKRGETHVITFEPSEDDRDLLIPSVRAVCIESPNEAWRGDDIGFELRKLLMKRMKPDESLWDLQDNPCWVYGDKVKSFKKLKTVKHEN